MAYSRYNKPLQKVTRKCGYCGFTPLKITDAHNMKLGGIPSKYEWLCKDCFSKWLDSEGDNIDEKE